MPGFLGLFGVNHYLNPPKPHVAELSIVLTVALLLGHNYLERAQNNHVLIDLVLKNKAREYIYLGVSTMTTG